MYGGSGKLGRGGGGGAGAGKRNVHSSFHPPPLRPSGPTGGRLSVGGGPRNRNTNSAGPASSAPSAAGPEETFSLVTGNPLNFAMIIRLVPDLVEEIKRVEAQGGTARIKFDSNANNTSGNVIDVGGKDFRFTWSREMGDLCDTYEERESGEDGNGLLVESGCAWRKLNVQRVLDESTKNHVKMRSEEAERKLKSRKAIILDHQNPSMKSQMKALAAVEVGPWKNFKQKKEPPPFKKRKIEPPPVNVGGPPRSAYKPGLSSTTAKSRYSVSPLPSPPEHSGPPASPFGIGTKGNTSVEDVIPIQASNKENYIGFEKEIPGRATSGTGWETLSVKGNIGAKFTDLQSLLISLLMDKPKGMNLKALEKAVGDTMPNSVKKIDPVLKKIATYQAPGRYFLKSGVEFGNYKKPSSESGSSPEDNHLQTPVPEDNCGQSPNPQTDLSGQKLSNELNSELGGESNSLEKIDIPHRSPDIFGEKKVSDNSEGHARSSSDSGSESDSDSDSSDSGSDSGGSHSKSRSKSRSPVGSGTGSSSDSETDASSNSKQGSDEDVDIMTSDDEKESNHKLQDSIPWRSPYGGPAQNSVAENQGHGSDVVEIEKDLLDDDNETEMGLYTSSIPSTHVEKRVEDTKPSSPEHRESQTYTTNLLTGRENTIIGDLFGERETVANDGVKREKISKVKSKRASDVRHSDEKPERVKKSKTGSLVPPPISQNLGSFFSESPHKFSLDGPIEDPYKGPSTQMKNKPERAKKSKAVSLAPAQISQNLESFFSESPHKLSLDGPIEDPYKGPSTQMRNKVTRDGNLDPTLQKGHKQGALGKSVSDSQESGRRSLDPSDRVKHAENSGRGSKYPDRNLHVNEGFPLQREKVNRETQKEDGYSNEKKLPRSSEDIVDSNRTIDRSHVINGRGAVLQRELSDLELGELREPLPENPGIKKQFERKSSFKQSENKQSSSDYWNSDLAKVKPPEKSALDTRKLSSPHLRGAIPRNQDGPIKKRTPEHHVEDLVRPHHRGQSQPQNPSRLDSSEVGVGPLLNKVTDVSSKTRHNDAYLAKESKTQKPTLATLTDTRKDTTLTESNGSVVKRRESSLDEDSCPYIKYEKEEPDLKGPIKDFSQYKEYVQEYSEKYNSYCSLNRILESDRDEFCKLGRDLDISKGRDLDKYHNVLRQLKESYLQCGARHKRQKKIFVVLHEELKHLKQMIKDYAES